MAGGGERSLERRKERMRREAGMWWTVGVTIIRVSLREQIITRKRDRINY